MAVSHVFSAIYFTFWGLIVYLAYDAYTRSAYKTLVIPLLLLVWKLWRYILRPFPKKRGPLSVDPSEIARDSGREATDLTKWHLTTEKGRHVWVYDEKINQTFADRYFLGLDVSKDAPALPKAKTVEDSLKNALDFYCKLQLEDGHWGNDYGGPLFLLPGLVFTCYITKTDLDEPFKKEIIRYLTSQQREDGGWGLHIESDSTMFGTVMNYVTMRLLGLPRADPRIVKARQWIEKKGGAASVPAWGKFWLCALNLYDWHGLNPIPPELWSLPYSLPFHPGRWWCHCRVVYLPMAYIYGTRDVSTVAPNKLIRDIREEMYLEVYETIDWVAQRNNINNEEDYKGHSWLVDLAFGVLTAFEQVVPQSLRSYANSVALDHIRYEDTETHGICIGPVNKAIDMLCEYWASNGGQSDLFKLHQTRVKDYLWVAADGCKMQGYNGSQLWDTAFSLQAIYTTDLANQIPKVTQAMVKGYDYIDISQVRENNPNREHYYRHISKGAWPFSTIDHGWPISDCTAEGFQCALNMPNLVKALNNKSITADRIFDSVNVMLSYQNTDGGWPSYENQRGPALLEMLNPADVFDGIMVDYSYTECSSACMKALLSFRKQFPHHRADEIDSALARGVTFLCNNQKADGGWHGCWGVCYTYAGWFALGALTECKRLNIGNISKINKALKIGFEYLLDKQHADGGWGEDFKSCVVRRWVDLPEGHVVNTAWAILALLNMDEIPVDNIKRGIAWLVKQQTANGDWEQTTISGVFNFNCAISYSGYKNIFPIWAMGAYLNKFGNQSLSTL